MKKKDAFKQKEMLGNIIRKESSNTNDDDDEESTDLYTDYCNVHTLQLDFRKIENINHLWKYPNLTKLQLDNNCIEKIHGLDELTQLTWLDLSFNKIKVIEGLDSLKYLEDLSLYSNLLTKLENMDNLNKLQIFSIGRNHIDEYEALIYLRKFQHLRCLTFENNPVKKEDYKLKVLVHLPFISYLDYRLVTEEMVAEARARYGQTVEGLEAQERIDKNTDIETLAKEAEMSLYRESFVDELGGEKSISWLIKETVTAFEQLSLAARENLHKLIEHSATHCKELTKLAIDSHKSRQQAIHEFDETHQKLTSELHTNRDAMLKDFQASKEKLLQSTNTSNTSNSSTQASLQLHKDIQDLWVDMVNAEIKLGEKIEDMISHLKMSMTTVIASFKTHVDTHFEYMKTEVDKCKIKMDALIADQEMADIACTTSRAMVSLRNQMVCAQAKMTDRADRWFLEIIHTLQAQELERNRQQMTEISQLVDNLRDELDNAFIE